MLSLPLAVLERVWMGCRERKEAVGGTAAQPISLLFFVCGAGCRADGLVTSKTKMNSEKFARINLFSLMWDVKHSHAQVSLHAYHRPTGRTYRCPVGLKHTPSAWRVCWRSVKCVLGLRNVIPVFIEIAYGALECKILPNTSCVTYQRFSFPKAVGVFKARS